MEPWTGKNVHCEQRMWGSDIACLCVCAGKEVESMEAFYHQLLALNPRYASDRKQLTAARFTLTFAAGVDDTQVL
jgi:hypothetical protein